mmetsp:Transcript_27468/g.65476  ORF Transcript_27468/g.65476 Transcript_27468/m.65476 type:complete len:200 (+) Transcript_27468:1014-1613(+)
MPRHGGGELDGAEVRVLRVEVGPRPVRHLHLLPLLPQRSGHSRAHPACAEDEDLTSTASSAVGAQPKAGGLPYQAVIAAHRRRGVAPAVSAAHRGHPRRERGARGGEARGRRPFRQHEGSLGGERGGGRQHRQEEEEQAHERASRRAYPSLGAGARVWTGCECWRSGAGARGEVALCAQERAARRGMRLGLVDHAPLRG